MFADLLNVSMTVLLDVRQFDRRSDDHRVCVTIVIWRPEDPSEVCDLQGSFLRRSERYDWTLLSESLLGSAEILYRRTYMFENTTLTLDRLIDEKYLTGWSNITMHYALVGFC